MNYFIKVFDTIYNWAKANSLTPLFYATSCCEIQMMTNSIEKNNFDKFGSDIFCVSPKQADLLIIAGTVTHKSAPAILRLYKQMPEPKYVIAMGACACSGGMFCNDSYSIVNGIDKIIPTDIYIPVCPPKDTELKNALLKLQEKIKSETITKRREYSDSHITELNPSDKHDILVYENN